MQKKEQFGKLGVMQRHAISATCVDKEWMRHHAEKYLSERDPKALELLPKLLPPPDPEQQKTDVASSKFNKILSDLSKL